MALLSPASITTMDEARRHRRWALGVLVIVYVFNFIDRQVLSILQEDIRKDLGLNDLQLGLLTGLSFAAWVGRRPFAGSVAIDGALARSRACTCMYVCYRIRRSGA